MTANDEKFPWEEDAETPAASTATATTDAASEKPKKGKKAAKPAEAIAEQSADTTPVAAAQSRMDSNDDDGAEVSPFRGMDADTTLALQLPALPELDALLAERMEFDRQVEDAVVEEGDNVGRTPLEARAEVPSLLFLHYRRRVLIRELAPLARLFDAKNPKPADTKRRQHRDVVGTLIAREQGITGDRIESKLERLANGDPRHIAFCRHMDALEDKYYEARNAFVELQDLIRDREIGLQSYNSELRAGVRADAGQV